MIRFIEVVSAACRYSPGLRLDVGILSQVDIRSYSAHPKSVPINEVVDARALGAGVVSTGLDRIESLADLMAIDKACTCDAYFKDLVNFPNRCSFSND